MIERNQIKDCRRWVVKVGSAILTDNGLSLSPKVVISLANQIAELRNQGVEVVLVSSGSIAAGIGVLGMSERPERLNHLQAAAAAGQAALVQAYDSAFSDHQIKIAQVLLTHSDIANRGRYLNARNTLQSLLGMDVLAIVNENDTVATDEICFGDNDSLAALVANLIDADLLVLLTDQDGLYDADPRSNPDAKLISIAEAGDNALQAMASGGGTLGRGGMITKLSAAAKASHSGASTVICNGGAEGVLNRVYQGQEIGTLLFAGRRVTSRKQWMAGQMRSEGKVHLDAGAAEVIKSKGRSVLAAGMTQVEGTFERGSLVSCLDPQGTEIARGLINYASSEAVKLIGLRSDAFADALGYRGDHELIHRNNLVLL